MFFEVVSVTGKQAEAGIRRALSAPFPSTRARWGPSPRGPISRAFLETARDDLSRSRRTFVSSRDTGVPVRVGRAGHPEQTAGSAGLHPDRESVQNEFETAEEVLVGFLVRGLFVREHLGSEHRRGLRKPFRVDKML